MAYGSPLGDFASGLASGFGRGMEIGNRAAEARREAEEYEYTKKKRKEDDDYKAGLKKAGEGGLVATTDSLDARYSSREEADNDIAVRQNLSTPAPTPEPVNTAMAALPAIPDLGGGKTSMAVAAPQAPQPQPAPQNFTPVQDPITHRWGVVDKSQTRSMSQLEIAERVAAYQQANGKPEDAARTLDAAYQLDNRRISAMQQKLSAGLSRAILGGVPTINAELDKNFNANNPLGVRVSATQVDGGFALKISQPGSAVPDSYIGPDGPSMTPTPMPLPEFVTLLDGVVKSDLPGAMRSISDFRSAVQARTLAKNQDARAGAAAQRDATLFPVQLTAAQLQVAGQRLGLKEDQLKLLAAGDLSGLSDEQKLNFIASNEQSVNGYNSVYGDTPDGKRGVHMPANITDMTIGQIVALQPQMTAETARQGVAGGRGTSAVGRYQFVRDTLIRIAPKSLGANWQNTKFSPAVQDKLALALGDEVGWTAQGVSSQWEGMHKFFSAGGNAVQPGQGALKVAAQDRQAALKAARDYVAAGAKNIVAPPGSPERANQLAALQNEAFQIYGVTPLAGGPPKEVNFTSGGKTQPAAPSKAPTRAPAPAAPERDYRGPVQKAALKAGEPIVAKRKAEAKRRVALDIQRRKENFR